jgi:hypothetical protein
MTHTIPIPGKRDSTEIKYHDHVILDFQMEGHLEVVNGDAFKQELTRSDVKKGKGKKMKAVMRTTVTLTFTESGNPPHMDEIVIV